MTAQQQYQLRQIETWSARIAAGVCATQALCLANRIAEDFAAYRQKVPE